MTRTTSIKKFLKLGLLIGLFSFITIYSIFQTKALAKGVGLTLSGIDDGEMFEAGVLTISGKAVHAKHVSINDKELPVDEEEQFFEELVLSPGYNIITVKAEDKFSKITKNTYHVYYDEHANALTAFNKK